MQGNAKERWFELCEQAATEHDTVKLYALVQEINRLLEEKTLRLNGEREAQRNSPCESGTRKKREQANDRE
ncbi:MAG: hypothetical protein DMG77_01230 [Acidobacteria bacterium]|nr:MAG: hypothetical protein DMG77_01230 [Acidobacteriota bacterium]